LNSTNKEIDNAIRRAPGRPKTYTDAERRAAIVDVARRTFTEFGYLGATTDEVAARCRISKQTLYKLFPSKSDIFLAVVRAHRRMMLDLPRPAEEDDPVETVLEKIFMIEIDQQAENERAAFIHAIVEESVSAPELSDILRREGVDLARRQLATWLDEQGSKGGLQLEDSESAAQMLMDMMLGAVRPLGRIWDSRELRQEHLRRCIRVFINGSRSAVSGT
jgi:AcrR family transcriptional regulator